MRGTWSLIALLLVSTSLFAQQNIFDGYLVEKFKKEELKDNFEEVKAFHFDAKAFHHYISDQKTNGIVKLRFDKEYNWDLELYPMDIYSESAVIRAITNEGELEYPVPRNISYYGQIVGQNQSRVMLIIHDQFVSGYIDDGEEKIIIESASNQLSDVASNLYLIYSADKTKTENFGECGEEYYPRFIDESSSQKENPDEKSVGDCYTVKLGIASDNLLFIEKGNTIQGVIDHIVSIMADVAIHYELDGDTNFDDGLEFEIVEQVVSTCNTCDRWTSSTDSGDVLDDFTAWGSNSGFNEDIDMGQFWTNRNFDGATVALAWRGADLLCNNSAYHVLQDFSSNTEYLRVMTTHEIGHNLNAGHDVTSGYIMSPSVTNVTDWSSTSQSYISQEINDQGGNCLSSCGGPSCSQVSNVVVSNITTSSFQLSFVPTTEGTYRIRVRDEDDRSIIHTQSTSSNSVTISPENYEACKIYEVIVENDCGASLAAPVTALFASPTSQGCAEFYADNVMDWNSLTVNFSDESSNATSWLWDFGDGTTSTLQNPTHTYTSSGYRSVSLTVNGAHTMMKNDFVVVLPEVSVPYGLEDGGNMDNEDFGAVSLTDGQTSIWERGVPTNYFENSTNAWVTDLDADLVSTDNMSILYSPKFDFSVQGDYTFSFDLGMEYFFCNAPYALQLQYSINDGETWTRLGSDTDANWYNRGPSSGCKIVTSLFSDEIGWTQTTQTTNYSYDVSFLSGNPSATFRFVFNVESGWNGLGYDNAGAMIDNVTMEAVLPVELLSFNGEALKDKIELKWETVNEINNDYFLIEKSFNGKDFFPMNEVAGNGNSYNRSSYSTFDHQPTSGINYYRLTQYDFGGNYKVFSTIAIAFGSDNTAIKIYPNPAIDNEIYLRYLTENSNNITIEIFDLTGFKLLKQDLIVKNGLNEFSIDISNFESGLYFIKINGEIKDKLVVTR